MVIKHVAAVAAVAVLAAPADQAVPIVGGSGLVPNAWAIVEYVQSNYPAVQSIGGVRACDWIGEHCRGVAVDIMVGGNIALGNQINADLLSQRGRFGIVYTLWQTDSSHADHVHVSVN